MALSQLFTQAGRAGQGCDSVVKYLGVNLWSGGRALLYKLMGSPESINPIYFSFLSTEPQ